MSQGLDLGDLPDAVALRAPEAEQARQLPQTTIDDLISTGFVTYLLPEELGGAHGDFQTFTKAVRSLSSGCASTGWVASFYTIHNWMAARFAEPVRSQMFGERGFTLAPAALSPDGRAEPEGDDWLLNGRWKWATGVQAADWVMVTGLAPRYGDLRDVRMFVLPIGDVEVVDTWHTDGMRGTGSNDVVVDGLIVPEERAVAAQPLQQGTGPSTEDGQPAPFGDTRMGLALVPPLALTAASVAVGVAEGVLDAFIARTSERVLAYTLGSKAKDSSAARSHVANGSVRVDQLVSVFETAVAELDRFGPGGDRTGDHFTDAERIRLRHTAATIVHDARRLVGELVTAAGASAHFLDSPLQRHQRDINTLSGHAVFDLDSAADLRGRSVLGLEMPFPAMF